MSFLWALGGFIIVLTPVVLIHELGHFWAARLSNIKVEEFGFGLPPRMMKLGERNGTIFSLNWIPLGGFVRPAGEDDPKVPGGLSGASKRARFFVLSAGAGANFIAAILIFWIALMLGQPAIAVGAVDPASPAEAAGLQAGDDILRVNGVPVDNTNVLVATFQRSAGEPVRLLIGRGDDRLEIDVTPRAPGEYDSAREGPIGISVTLSTSGARVSQGPLEAGRGSLRFMADETPPGDDARVAILDAPNMWRGAWVHQGHSVVKALQMVSNRPDLDAQRDILPDAKSGLVVFQFLKDGRRVVKRNPTTGAVEALSPDFLAK